MSKSAGKKIEFYYFSPTGGTKMVGETLVHALGEMVSERNLGEMMRETAEPKKKMMTDELAEEEAASDLTVFALPVFGGRLPAAAAEYLKTRAGNGKKTVSLVVYGVRAYEDALLELNDILTENGFEVIASGAFIAQHSIVPAVGAGRPDERDKKEICEFAEKILEKVSALEMPGEETEDGIQRCGFQKIGVSIKNMTAVPGNRPYKDGMTVAAAPICLPSCKKCGRCEAVCPTGAIQITEENVITDVSKCLLCMACRAVCPSSSRILPPPMQEAMNQKLSALKDVRRENEMFL